MTVSTEPRPFRASERVPSRWMGAPAMSTVITPWRAPSLAAGPQSWVSVTARVAPTRLWTKEGKLAVGRSRLLTMTVRSPLALMDTLWLSAPVATHLRFWKISSASMAKTSWGVAG